MSKTIKVEGKKHQDVKMQLDRDLKQWYLKENLNLIGGFQDNQQQLQLFFFKQDVKQSVEIEIFIEEYVTNRSNPGEKDIEALVNAAHLDTNGILRCCISLGNDPRTHLFVFQVLPGDKIYMILKFPETL